MTGNEAHEVTRVAAEFKARLDLLEAAEGKAKDAGMKALGVVSAVMSLASLALTDPL